MSDSAAMSGGESGRVLLLGVDTSSEGDLAIAELYSDGHLELFAREHFSARHQSTEFIPRLTLLLATASATIEDIRAIIVVSGPGSFTGLRIGLSATKGLAEAANIPVIAISSLAVLGGAAEKETVAVAIAGRSEYYARLVSSESGEPMETLETEASLQGLIANKTVIVSESSTTDAAFTEKFSTAKLVTPGKIGAYQALLAALPRFLAADFDDISTLDANYVRRPYTELAAEAKPAS